jgi:hypothetical protein
VNSGLAKVLTEISQRGYSATLNVAGSKEHREPTRKEDKERGAGKRWAAVIRREKASATDFDTGFSDSPFEALTEAMDRAGLKISGINLK